MNNVPSVSTSWRTVWAGPFRWIVLGAGVLGVLRYSEFFWQQEWLNAVLYPGLFWLGASTAALFWTLSPWWLGQLQHWGLRFSTRPDYSPLRTPLLFLVLPVLGVFLVSSSRAPFGLGFLWSLSVWYAFEAWRLYQGDPSLIQSYFTNQQQLRAEGIQALILAQIAYTVLITAGLLVI